MKIRYTYEPVDRYGRTKERKPRTNPIPVIVMKNFIRISENVVRRERAVA